MSHPFELQQTNHVYDLAHGFLPKNEPIAALPTDCHAWEACALDLPKLIAHTDTRALIEALPEFPLTVLSHGAALERAMLLLSYLGHAYVWGDVKQAAQALPENLAKPWYFVAQQLGRPPILSYASYALYNWRKLDNTLPIELGNIALLQNFLGGIDEEWFILIHVDIEAKAIAALQVLQALQQAMLAEDFALMTAQLQTIAGGLEAMCQTLQRMPEHCDPYIYYNRVRPYIHGWQDNPALPNGLLYKGVSAYQNQPQKFKGETGAQSSIIPAFDIVLGIDHKDNPLKQHLIEMRDYMPPTHRAFLKQLEQTGSIRDTVKDQKRKEKSLRAAYNQCIALIFNFRSIHLGFAKAYIDKQSQSSPGNPTTTGTGGTPFMQYLKKHKKETKQYLI